MAAPVCRISPRPLHVNLAPYVIPDLIRDPCPAFPARGSACQRQRQWQLAFALRPRNGKPAVTDGPYAEARELVGGFFIIEAADRDEAVRVASLHPAATLGESVRRGIEVHPIGFFEQVA